MPTVKYKNGNNWSSVSASGSIATDSTYGYVKVATDADISAGTNNTAAVTAKGLKTYGDTNYVHKTGNETIAGVKTFSGAIKSTIKDSTVPNNAFSGLIAGSNLSYFQSPTAPK